MAIYQTHQPQSALYPATIACLTHHLGTAAGSIDALGTALSALEDLVVILGSPDVPAPDFLAQAILRTTQVFGPLLDRGDIEITTEIPATATGEDPLRADIEIYGCAQLLAGLLSEPEAGLMKIAVELDSDGDGPPALTITEYGVLEPPRADSLLATAQMKRFTDTLAIYGARLDVDRDPACTERCWRLTVPDQADRAAPAEASSPARERRRMLHPDTDALAAGLASVRDELRTVKDAAAKSDNEGCEEGLESLREIAETKSDLDLLGMCERAIVSARSGDLLDVSVITEEIETLLVRHMLERSGEFLNDANTAQPTILVVDDDLSIRTTLRKILELDGFRVIESGDGVEAVANCREERPDLIIMDAVMPNKDGFAATEEILSIPQNLDIPVLIATALDDNESIERAFNAGAADYIHKPFHFNTIRQRIARLLNASRHAAHAKRLAWVDTVTGLPNRSQFQQQLLDCLREARTGEDSFALVFIDLERFKLVNETMGHDVGDSLLRTVAERLAAAVRAEDVVARLGSDEFAVVARNVPNREAAAAVAEKIVLSVAQPLRVMSHELYTACTLGITLCPQDGAAVSNLMRHADSALFHARSIGQPYAFYDQSMESRASNRFALEGDLRRALGKDQFELHYQPQICLKSARCIGAEALVRWRHPERGLVSPAEFIPLAEDTGLIVEMGYWVINEACRFAREVGESFSDSDLDRLSINVSSRQLDCPDLVRQITEALDANGISGDQLEIEITESAVMKRGDSVSKTLNAIKDLGVRIAIDDFGTGYCSFGYLKKFPIDVLKIDRSLIRDIIRENDDREIVRAILALADTLRLDTVAEGVENLDEIELLRDMGCTTVQGFYFSKPIPGETFIASYCGVSGRDHIRASGGVGQLLAHSA